MENLIGEEEIVEIINQHARDRNGSIAIKWIELILRLRGIGGIGESEYVIKMGGQDGDKDI